MEQPVQLVNRWLCLLLLAGSCNVPAGPTASGNTISVEATGLHAVNGILMLGSERFTGTVFTLYPGTTDTARIARYQSGKEHGVWKKWYSNGKLEEIRTYDNGSKTGQYLAFWENGNKQMDYFFTADEYQGNCREWNSEGRLIRNMHYDRGHEEGVQQQFYDNGKVRSNYVIKNGRRYGLLGTKNCVNATDNIAINP